jgi:hypothetical protein
LAPTAVMMLVSYARRPVAMAGPDRFYLAPHIDHRSNGDPLKRFVCFLAAYARDAQTGVLPDDRHQYVLDCRERYAREALMPAHVFGPLQRESNPSLAERFEVPIEQIGRRRTDLEVSPTIVCKDR